VVVGREQAEIFRRDPQNLSYMDHATVADTLEGAMEFAKRATGTDKVLVFDGARGGMNCSGPLAELLVARAPAVSERVDRVLLPKWLRQRGVPLEKLSA
jgi:hypothetical protein